MGKHLEGCTSCLNFIETYKATTALVKDVSCEERPEVLKSRLTSFLQAKIRQEKAAGEK